MKKNAQSISQSMIHKFKKSFKKYLSLKRNILFSESTIFQYSHDAIAESIRMYTYVLCVYMYDVPHWKIESIAG